MAGETEELVTQEVPVIQTEMKTITYESLQVWSSDCTNPILHTATHGWSCVTYLILRLSEVFTILPLQSSIYNPTRQFDENIWYRSKTKYTVVYWRCSYFKML